MYVAGYDSPLGKINLAGDDNGLAGVWFCNQKYVPEFYDASQINEKNIPVIMNAVNWLDAYFKGDKPNICDLELFPYGSEFRKSVWKLLCNIPYGETVTYSDIAIELSEMSGKNKMSAQAVGNAVSHNPILIIIPCHRVIGKDGNIKEYSAGVERKVKLLEHERSHLWSF